MYNYQQESTVNQAISTNADTRLTDKQIVFIDSQVADYQTLVAGVFTNTDVVVLNGDANRANN